MITRKDHQWSTILCPNELHTGEACDRAFKVLIDQHMSVLACPYCGKNIVLNEGTAPVVQNKSLDEVAAEAKSDNAAAILNEPEFTDALGEMLIKKEE